MVKYSCGICSKNYDSLEEAEKCENKGLIGPDLEPGLLFSHKKSEDGFLVFYKENNSIGHDRVYFIEEIFQFNPNHIDGIRKGNLTTTSLEKFLDFYRVSTESEVKYLNDKFSQEIKGISSVKVYMDKFEIEKLHNNFSLEESIFSIEK